MHANVFRSIIEKLRAFRADEDGAVTADFVVLTASVMLMGAAHVADVASGTNNISQAIESCLVNDVAGLMDGPASTSEEYITKLEAAAAGCSSR